jgi:hypothetical protein
VQFHENGVAAMTQGYYPTGVRTMTIKVPEPLFAEIANAAKVRRVSKSEIVRERLVGGTAVKSESPATSLWSRMEDLVIQSDRLPVDLSSDKKHLADYGKKHPR